MVTKTLPKQTISQDLDLIKFMYNLLLSLHGIELTKTRQNVTLQISATYQNVRMDWISLAAP